MNVLTASQLAKLSFKAWRKVLLSHILAIFVTKLSLSNDKSRNILKVFIQHCTMWKIHKKIMNQCKICDFKSPRRTTLKAHVKQVHVVHLVRSVWHLRCCLVITIQTRLVNTIMYRLYVDLQTGHCCCLVATI